MVTGSAKQVVSQLRDFLGLGFTGFNFNVSGAGQTASMQRIAEEVLPVLRSTG
jgi:alkanesulfonate monooxygenase SsuD/methylene tetrahydromethanopterin reductase-like flavin-dependent oxidoreductase (luciferase family)